MERVARFVLRRRRAVLVAALLFLVVAGAVGGGVAQQLSSGGFESEDAESARASRELAANFQSGAPNLVLLVTDSRGADDPSVAQAGTALTGRLADEEGVAEAASYWTLGRPEALRSGDGEKALILARITGDEDAALDRFNSLQPEYEGNVEGVDVRLGGLTAAQDALVDKTEEDLARSEAIVFPITLVALALVFGSIVAASLPLAVGALTMLGALLILRIMVGVTDVSVLALNVTTGLGLGLAIDYSLLMVSRYREELRQGREVDEAIRITMRTAGRTVLFSAVTVAFALAGLLVFPFFVLRSFSYAGIATALMAAATSVIVLPALLRVIGRRVDKLRVFRRREPGATTGGFWRRAGALVTRRPIPVATVVIVILVVFALPFFRIQLAPSDERTLPKSAEVAQVGQVLREEFPSHESEALQVVATGIGDPAAQEAEITAYAERLSAVPNVARVDALTGSFANGTQVAPATEFSARYATAANTYLRVVPTVDAYSEAGEQLVRDVRDVGAPFPVKVGGTSASFVDSIDIVGDRLPFAFAIVAISTLVLLFLITGSVILPIIGIVLSMMGLAAALGVSVWVFQDGNLQALVGDFTVTGTITYSIPIVIFAIAFGLSMDYGVFLWSRIKEERERTGDYRAAVVAGLARAGRVVIAAAALIALVFLSFVPSGVTYMKVVGLGLALAVIVDAVLIRNALVPAVMRLLGRANWWAPRPLRSLHERVGLTDEPTGETVTPPSQPPPLAGQGSTASEADTSTSRTSR